jgi:acetyltransferase-like isoleucine patch superfamily enzyme
MGFLVRIYFFYFLINRFFIIIHFDVVLENHVIIGRPVQLPTNPSWTYHPIEHFCEYYTLPIIYNFLFIAQVFISNLPLQI